ncbi:MAG: thermonuclease family protein [Xenococcaceae cyanobacterium]
MAIFFLRLPWIKINNKWQLVQQKQAENGWVWAYEQYKSDCRSWEAIANAVEQAKAAKRGIWNGSPEAPWVWRKRNK